MKVCPECHKEFKCDSHVRLHRMHNHDINVEWKFCNIDECTHKAKTKQA